MVAAVTVSARVAVCFNEPEVPVKVIVNVPTAAVEAAVRLSDAALPGVRVSVEGLTVTPVGRPESATATEPVNPLTAAAARLTDWPAAPAVSVRDVGLALKVKSAVVAAAETVSATAADWLREPDFPVMVTVELPADAEDAAVNVTFCATPGVRESEAGLAVTPVGRPLTVTATVALKPLVAAASTVKLSSAPAARVSVVTDAVTVKLAAGVGCVEELLHAVSTASTASKGKARIVLASARMLWRTKICS